MQFMNDPEIQSIIHVRGYNLPGLNFYPEKSGTKTYRLSPFLLLCLFVCSYSFSLSRAHTHLNKLSLSLTHTLSLSPTRYIYLSHTRYLSTSESNLRSMTGGVDSQNQNRHSKAPAPGNAGYFSPGSWVVCDDNIVSLNDLLRFTLHGFASVFLILNESYLIFFILFFSHRFLYFILILE